MGVLNYGEINDHARDLLKEFDVRTVSEVVPKALSGGNQQKAIIAREISRDPELLIVANPTRKLSLVRLNSSINGLLNNAITLKPFSLWKFRTRRNLKCF